MVLFDSNDGVLIAPEDFFDYARGRANFRVKVDAVAAHDQRLYGKFLPDNLINIGVDRLVLCATPERNVMSWCALPSAPQAWIVSRPSQKTARQSGFARQGRYDRPVNNRCIRNP
ncbi:MAG TPA: hypothetical protein VF797_16980 [Noviherbaspirillum sp.]